jgi:hypothetical protein
VQVSVPSERPQDAAHRVLLDECPLEMPELPPLAAGRSAQQVARAHFPALRGELELLVSARLARTYLDELQLEAVQAPLDVVRQAPSASPDQLAECLVPLPLELRHWAALPVVPMAAHPELQAGAKQRARRLPDAVLRQAQLASWQV